MKLACVTDIHEDIASLERTFRMIEKMGCDEIACLGDIVGFSVPHYKYYESRDANACCKLVAQNAKYTVAGNHDHFAIRKLPTEAGGFHYPDDWYDLPYDQRKKRSGHKLWLYEHEELSALLNEQSKQWLHSLPESLIIDADNQKILISHFLSPDITGATTDFIFSGADFLSHEKLMKQTNSSLAFFGHMHSQGMCVIREGKEQIVFSRKLKFKPHLLGIGVPAIASNKHFSGFVVYNTTTQTIETFSLRSKFNLF